MHSEYEILPASYPVKLSGSATKIEIFSFLLILNYFRPISHKVNGKVEISIYVVKARIVTAAKIPKTKMEVPATAFF